MRMEYAVYLGGSMHGRLGKEVIAERAKAKLACQLHGVTFYDPAADENISPNSVVDLKPNTRRMKWYVSKDDYHIDRCKVLLILTGDVASSGTLWEAGRMFYKCKRPIVVVAPKMAAHQLVNFTTIKATKITDTVENAVKYIKRNLL